MPQTAIRFSSGGEMTVGLWLDEVRDLVSKALTNNVLLEIKDSDGKTVVINVHQITTIVTASSPPPRRR
jgi:Protein of unknown function (DUF3107)